MVKTRGRQTGFQEEETLKSPLAVSIFKILAIQMGVKYYLFEA